MTRSEVVRTAKSYIGVRWRHMGRSRASGVDCVGLLVCVGKDTGLLPADFSNPPYPHEPDGTLLSYFREWGKPISRAGLKDGSLIVYGYHGSPYHAAIVIDAKRGAMVHSFAAERAVVVDRIDNRQLGRTFVGAFDYKGIKDG